jgi:alpha-tubulin suppressor-like RCC1 family protein
MAWGNNLRGQLGLNINKHKTVTQLTQVNSLSKHNIAHVYAGYAHSIALSELGYLFFFVSTDHSNSNICRVIILLISLE